MVKHADISSCIPATVAKERNEYANGANYIKNFLIQHASRLQVLHKKQDEINKKRVSKSANLQHPDVLRKEQREVAARAGGRERKGQTGPAAAAVPLPM